MLTIGFGDADELVNEVAVLPVSRVPGGGRIVYLRCSIGFVVCIDMGDFEKCGCPEGAAMDFEELLRRRGFLNVLVFSRGNWGDGCGRMYSPCFMLGHCEFS